MQHTILHAPTFSTLRLDCGEGEVVHSQPGTMQAMSPGFHIEAKAGLLIKGERGMFSGVRSLFGGESFFTAVYRAKRDGQFLLLAPSQMGEIRPVVLTGDNSLLLARGAFLACEPTVSFELHNAGVQGVLATRGLFFLRTVGAGLLFLSSYGGILEQELAEGERFVLDNSNIVAFSSGMNFESVVLTKSLKDSFLSGEGFVVRFTGPGKVIYQTRSRPSMGLIRGFLTSIT